MVEIVCLGYDGSRISRIWWNYAIWDMVELGYLGYGGLGYRGYGGTVISRIWLN